MWYDLKLIFQPIRIIVTFFCCFNSLVISLIPWWRSISCCNERKMNFVSSSSFLWDSTPEAKLKKKWAFPMNALYECELTQWTDVWGIRSRCLWLSFCTFCFLISYHCVSTYLDLRWARWVKGIHGTASMEHHPWNFIHGKYPWNVIYGTSSMERHPWNTMNSSLLVPIRWYFMWWFNNDSFKNKPFGDQLFFSPNSHEYDSTNEHYKNCYYPLPRLPTTTSS